MLSRTIGANAQCYADSAALSRSILHTHIHVYIARQVSAGRCDCVAPPIDQFTSPICQGLGVNAIISQSPGNRVLKSQPVTSRFGKVSGDYSVTVWEIFMTIAYWMFHNEKWRWEEILFADYLWDVFCKVYLTSHVSPSSSCSPYSSTFFTLQNSLSSFTALVFFWAL